MSWHRSPDLCAIVLVIALSACGAPVSQTPDEAALEPAETGDYEIIARYQVDHRTWQVVLVAPGLSDDELTDVSKGLVARFPESSFRIFDDGSQMELYLEWRRNPNVEEVAKPAVWIGDHHVATIRRIRTEQGLELQLRGGPAHPTQPGRKISSLGS